MIEFWLEIGRSFFVVKHSLFLLFPSVRTLYSSDAPSSLLGTCIQTRLAAYISLSTVHTENPTVLRAFTRFEHHSSVFSDLYKLTVIGRNVCLSEADDDPVKFSLLFWLTRLENPLRKFFFSLKLHFSRAANKNEKKNKFLFNGPPITFVPINGLAQAYIVRICTCLYSDREQDTRTSSSWPLHF